jgi:glutamate-1-semialdehyde 2,1-aminomutase
MASSAVIPINPSAENIKIKVKTGQANINLKEALEIARKRFVERNPRSLKLFEEATKSLPGGNTRHVLFTAPFPVYLQRGEDCRVFSEDDEMYVCK